jgi:UDP-2,3-diacylglucosamine pyrophosphatase LpxH
MGEGCLMERPPLRFREDGTFTIVQFTDLHIAGNPANDNIIYDLMRRIMEVEQPDLVVFTGDVIYAPMCEHPEESYRKAVDVVEQTGIPWAAIYGNHDAEIETTKEALMALQQSYANCYSEPGPRDIHGIGNYMLPIVSADNQVQAALYFLDTGENAEHSIGGYEWIRRSQMNWYAEQSDRLKAENHKLVPALMFCHIPMQEFIMVWDTQTCYGQKNERVACAQVNSGFFTTMVEQGDVMGVFVGHDHTNDYWGCLHGIRLSYGRVTGDNVGGRIKRGARVIRLTAGDSEFESWIHEDDGTIIKHQPEHQPERTGWA